MDKKNIQFITPASINEWHEWLKKNHATESSVWMIYFKATSGKPTVRYSDAVDEALCFGWIDSKAQSIDAESYKQYFCKRKPNSVWSKVNKAKVENLLASGRMQPAGLKVIEMAKANGMWSKLDDAEALVVPNALQEKLNTHPDALAYFNSLSRSDKRNLLQWLTLAKRDETKIKRMDEIFTCATEGKKPKGF